MSVRALLLALSMISLSSHAAWIQRFTPQGVVNKQSRASAVFSEAMVPLGQPLAAAPFNVECGAVKGGGRWADTRTWTWQLERALLAGESCTFHLRKDVRSVAGNAVDAAADFRFFAAGPLPRRITPAPGNAIEEDQAFVIETAGPVDTASFERNAWCEAEGVGNRIPLRRLAEADRKAVLAATRRTNDALVASCAERLPAGTRMKLVWGRGIASAAGPGAKSAQEESFVYPVREAFRATLSCERENAAAPCSPLSNVTLEFSTPIDATLRGQFRLVTPEGVRMPVDPARTSATRENTLRSVTFARPLPANAEMRLEPPPNIKDEAGRPLTNAASFPLKFRVGHLPPLAKFAGDFGIVELKEGGVLPVTLRNIESRFQLAERRLTDDAEVIATMQSLARFNRQTRKVSVMRDGKLEEYEDAYYGRELSFLAGQAGTVARELPKPGGSAEFEVVGIPLAKPGYHIVEIESRLLGAALLAAGKDGPRPMYVRGAALVTNLSVHLKLGNDNALVWVTSLDAGEPVANAEVRISGCDGKPLWSGRTDARGRALANHELRAPSCDDASFVFASARLGDDYSFVRSDWNEGIEPWRFGVTTWAGTGGKRIGHTIFDRTLLRPGQTVSMKHVVRERGSNGMGFPVIADLPKSMLIRHQGGDAEFPVALEWDAQGTAVSTWKIPEAAKLGTYTLDVPGGGEFRVSDFRLPVFTGRVQGAVARAVAAKSVPLSLGLDFLNGGAAKGAAVKVSATVRPTWPSWAGYENFGFQVGFGDAARAAFGLDSRRESEQLVLDKQALTLDQAGAGKLEVKLPAPARGPAELYAEMSFDDPNGERQTLHGTVPLWPAAVVLGMHIPDWLGGVDKGRVDLVALDLEGKPVAGQEIRVLAKRRVSYSHRRRIVGGFYAYENRDEFTDLGSVCNGRTDARGMLRCQPALKGPGEILLLAETSDAQGNSARSGNSVWVDGEGGDTWFAAGNQDRIDVIPEKPGYQPGDTARFQVRTPFREATALISIEAAGVIETFVRPISRWKPVVELPVKADWAPNVFVSVLVVRGRVQPLRWYSFFTWGWREPVAWFREWWRPPQATAMVDLSRPSWRLGLAEIEVGTAGMKLDVSVLPGQRDYRPREEAVIRLKVAAPGGKPPPAGTELAFAAVDQALLELQPNASWDVLAAMTPERAYEVQTATAQSQVVGKRHYGRKAVPPGGGGGRAPARELFDTLLSWQPRVKVSADGTATVRVTINDALSEFRLVGVATGGAGLFGSGSAAIRSRQDVQLISGLPPLVRENDRYQAMLTVRNGSTRAMTLRVIAHAGGKELPARELHLAAEAAGELQWEARAPEGLSAIEWEFEATEQGGAGRDRLKITQRVEPAVPVTVRQASLARIDGAFEMPVAIPDGALPDKGGVEIALSARLATPPPGLLRFFETYPFACTEQKASVAVGLHDEVRWRELAASLPALLDEHGLARYFAGEGAGSVTLTAYLLDLAALSGFALPAEVRARMESGLTGYVEGRFKAPFWSPSGLDAQLAGKLTALEALTRGGPTEARTRAASALEPNLLRLPTSALIDWYLVLRRLTNVPERATRLAAAEGELRNRLGYSGGRLAFTTESADYWWWMMVSGNSNSFRLIEAVIDEPGWRDDLPKLLRGALERQARGHWGTTTANAWATLTLDAYARRFEREAVSGTTHAALGKAVVARRWPPSGAPERFTLPWPSAPQALKLRHEGSGKPWANMQTLAAIPAGGVRDAGYRVTRRVTPLEEKTKGTVSRGNLWRVTLEVEAAQDMTWVVLDDPIPAGARILGAGDGRDSRIATRGEDQRERGLWPSFIERGFSGFRAYYEVVPRGRFRIEYTLRLNNAGDFALPPTRVEAMYAPDMFGESPNGRLTVAP